MLTFLSFVSLFIPSTILEVRQTIIAMGFEPLWLIVAIIGFALSTVYTPAVSLSLEGKNINLLKSLPIQSWTMIQSKIYFNLVLTLPIIVVSTLIGTILFQIEIPTMILLMSMLIMFEILLSVFFMYLNLWFPRFDFHQEVEVVKQSLASLVAVFGGFSFLGALLWLALDFFIGFDLHLRLFLLTLIELVVVVLGGWFLKRKAEAYFQTFSV
jgi:ABC-2 type transport system permease protein